MTLRSPAQQTSTAAPRVPALDGVRGFAILLVFFFHYLFYPSGDAPVASVALRALIAPARFGWTGVDLFFVLSGFLITGILYDTRTNSHYFRNFYIRRVLRIFPLYYLLIICLLVLTTLLRAHWRLGHLWFLAYLGNPAVVLQPNLTQISSWIRVTHLWSLAVEEQFYLVWPLLVYWVAAPKKLLRICWILVVTALCFRTTAFFLHLLPAHAIYVLLFSRMDALAVGSALAILMRTKSSGKILKVLQITGALALIAALMIEFVRRANQYDPLMLTLGYTLVALGYAACLLRAVNPATMLHRFFLNRGLRFFGKYSYGLYVNHFVLIPVLATLIPLLTRCTRSETVAQFLFVAISAGVCVLVAMATYHWVEVPFLRLKDHFSYFPAENVGESVDVARSVTSVERVVVA